MTDPTMTYRQGYLDGSRDIDGATIAAAHDAATDVDPVAESDYWLGFYHGRAARRMAQGNADDAQA